VNAAVAHHDDPPITRIELEHVLDSAARAYGVETARFIWRAHEVWRRLNGLEPIPWEEVAPKGV